MSRLTMVELAERLAELKRSDVPRCSIERLGAAETWAGLGPHALVAVERYLRGFAAPGERSECPCCRFGRFSWGLVHGAGSCSCGWPGRFYHFVYDEREEPTLVCRDCACPRSEHGDRDACPGGDYGFRPPLIVRFEVLLWAHPYTVKLNTRRRS